MCLWVPCLWGTFHTLEHVPTNKHVLTIYPHVPTHKHVLTAEPPHTVCRYPRNRNLPCRVGSSVSAMKSVCTSASLDGLLVHRGRMRGPCTKAVPRRSVACMDGARCHPGLPRCLRCATCDVVEEDEHVQDGQRCMGSAGARKCVLGPTDCWLCVHVKEPTSVPRMMSILIRTLRHRGGVVYSARARKGCCKQATRGDVRVLFGASMIRQAHTI